MSEHVVYAETCADLQPLDMVAEGVFIRELTYDIDNGECGWTVAPLRMVWVDYPDAPRPVLEQSWGEPQPIPLDLPVRVIRGVSPPRDAPLPASDEETA